MIKCGLTVALLVYKEEENLRFLIPQIKGYVDELSISYEIIVVDTEHALDNTEDVCRKYLCRYINHNHLAFYRYVPPVSC